MEDIYVALDVEMTGVEAGIDEIIEVGAVRFRGDEVLDTFSQLIRPHQSLPLKISRLTGITAEMLADAPTFNEIAPQLVQFVQHYPLVGHSIGFDLEMLHAQGMNFGQRVYDTFDMATLLLPRASVYRLSALAEYLGVAHPDDHRALNDADVSRQVFLHLLKRIEAMHTRDLLELHQLMQRTDWTARELVADIARRKAGDLLNTPISAQRDARGAFNLQPFSRETPLEQTGNTEPVENATVAAFFGPDGVLSRHFANYEQRPQQAQMAQAVNEAFNEGAALMVEAGTGTGKSMSYLVPAAMFAARRGERVVVSTNTINLQDQLFAKDIPDVQRMLADDAAPPDSTDGTPDEPWPELKAALLKGRSNYLCLRRYKRMHEDENLPPAEARALLKVQLWLPTTGTGDRAELLLMEDEQRAWGRMNVTPDTCTAQQCPYFRECFFFRARRQAEAAHLVVVNHALLLADLVSPFNVLPAYDHVIIDEAHNLEDVATDQFGFRIDRPALLKFCDDLFQSGGVQNVSGLLSEYQVHFRESSASQEDRDRADQLAEAMRPLVERARSAIEQCFTHLLDFVSREMPPRNVYELRLRLTSQLRRKPDWAEIEQVWENLNLALTAIAKELAAFEQLLRDLEGADLLDYDELLLRVEWLQRTATDFTVQMGHIFSGDDETVCWIGLEQARGILTLNAAPIHVDELLQTQLFAEKQSSILTSATLAIDNSFAFIKERLGLDDLHELQLDSPFDYEQQAMVYIPTDIPEPNQQGYQQKVEETLIRLCAATAGRTLTLFTASNMLKQTYYGIREPLEEHEITVLAQGIDGSRRVLLERFKEWPRSVLLGTSSFWEGVDVVGEALSVLVIARLPFNVPSDPIFAARSERFNDPFLEYSVPQSILRFKQGFGRLIRSREDRGLVVVLDGRLIKKRYGQKFLLSLPATSVRTGTLQQLPSVATRFLDGGRGTGNGG